MNSFQYSNKNTVTYLITGITLILAGLGMIGFAIVYIIGLMGTGSTYGNDTSISFIAGLFAIGGIFAFFGAGNFKTVFKQRAEKYIVEEEGVRCKSLGPELFIPFKNLGISETEMTAIVTDRREQKMITVTNDLENYDKFVKLLKSKKRGI